MVQWLQIEPTTRCNLSCPSCSRTQSNVHIRDILPSTLRRILHDNSNATYVKLQGLGEPFFTPNIEYMVDIIREYGMEVTTITNGTIPISERLARKFKSIYFSINFLDPIKQQESKPRVDLDFILGNLHTVREYCKCGVNQVLTGYTTKDDIRDMQEFCTTFQLKHSIVRMENWYTPNECGYEQAKALIDTERSVWGPVDKRMGKCPWALDIAKYYDADGDPHPCCIRTNDCHKHMDRDSMCCGVCPE